MALGTNTDPYQRAEGRYRLMPGIIAALAESGTPFSILTKGPLLRRDLPLLVEASRSVTVGLGVSVAILDPALHASLEPGTADPRARLDLVRSVTDAGLACGVMVAPVLPWLTDSVAHLDALLARIAAAGASGATVLPLHLRPGAREWTFAWLRREHPELVGRYESLYAKGAYVPAWYAKRLAVRVQPLLETYGLGRSRTRADRTECRRATVQRLARSRNRWRSSRDGSAGLVRRHCMAHSGSNRTHEEAGHEHEEEPALPDRRPPLAKGVQRRGKRIPPV